jgi:DNA invertase Pin-like site-specific DNA recombinase
MKQPQKQFATPKTAVIYLRVSTERQGEDGLGIEAQRSLVARYLRSKELGVEREFVEVQSGGDDERPKLAEALRLSKSRNLPLVVAKQDRLSRNASFALKLFATHNIVVAESPEDSRLARGVKAVVDDEERVRIASRTKQSLDELERIAEGLPVGGVYVSKRNRIHRKIGEGKWMTEGVVGERAKLRGSPTLALAGMKGALGKRLSADRFALSLRPVLVELFTKGKLSTSPELADALNARGVRPATFKEGVRESRWHPSGVRNVLARLQRLGESVAVVAGT